MSLDFDDRLADILAPKSRRCATCRALAALNEGQRKRFEDAREHLSIVDQARVLGVNDSTYRGHLKGCS